MAPLMAGHAEHAVFWRAILEQPEDDAPGLAYAEWLEQNNELERGELVRLQLTRAKKGPDDPDDPDLREREEEILQAHGDAWRTNLPAWVRPKVSFRRGVPAHLTLTAQQLLQQGKALGRQVIFDSLRLEKTTGYIQELVSSGLLAGLRHLHLSFNALTEHDVVLLANCADLSTLVTLTVANNPFGPTGCEALANTPHLRSLTTLDASCCDATLVEMVARSATLSKLRCLRCSGMGVKPETITRLAQSQMVSHLEELTLADSRVGTEGARALVQAPLHRLRWLDLGNCGLGDEGSALLMRADWLPRVLGLRLSNNGIGPIGCLTLAAAPLEQLRSLRLQHNPLGDAGLEALAQAQNAPRLQVLAADVTAVGDHGIQALTRGTLLEHLIRLSLDRNHGISAVGAKALADCPQSARLRELSLGGCSLGPDGARAIAASCYLVSLRDLLLHGNKIGPEGAAFLANTSGLKQVRKLVLHTNGIGDTGARALLGSAHARGWHLEVGYNNISQSVRRELQQFLGQRASV